MSPAPAPLLVLGWGNPSRGDDAIGPMLAERLQRHAERVLPPGRLACLTDFQLQVEHALDLVGRERVLFVDAALDLDAPCTIRPLEPVRGTGLVSHALVPETVLQVYQDLFGRPPPPCTLLAIRGREFELGAAPSAEALAALQVAYLRACDWLGGTTDPQAADSPAA